MGLSNITLSISSSPWTCTPSFSECYASGLNHTGSFTLKGVIEDNLADRIWVLCDASKNALKAYWFESDGTAKLSDMFPGYELIGGYLGNQSNSIYFPIVAGYTACGAPTACAVNVTLSNGNVTLSWSGAKAGTSNAITGYEVQRAESTNGSTWGTWAALTTTTATSLSVAPPTTPGNYYKYRVRTRGAAGSAYYSGWKESTNKLRRDHAALAGFTDSPIVAGTTPVKALHMTELQACINTLRTFYGLSAYAFSPIDAHGIAGWTAHVNELREALDAAAAAAGKSHETWLEIPVNCPRADVMNQLRAVVLAL